MELDAGTIEAIITGHLCREQRLTPNLLLDFEWHAVAPGAGPAATIEIYNRSELRESKSTWTISFDECEEGTPGAIKIHTASGEEIWGLQQKG